MLYYMAYESGVQAQLQSEADAHCAHDRALVDYEAIAKLRYVSALTQETLRLRSAAPLILVEPTHAVTLGAFHLPAGTKLYLLTRHAALSADNFHDPHAFSPERWLTETPGTACPVHKPRAMLAFGGGPRTCAGRALALLECAMVASMVARNFSLEVAVPRDSVDEVFEFAMQPRGVRLRFRARERAS
jgi:cytochrome P450